MNCPGSHGGTLDLGLAVTATLEEQDLAFVEAPYGSPGYPQRIPMPGWLELQAGPFDEYLAAHDEGRVTESAVMRPVADVPEFHPVGNGDGMARRTSVHCWTSIRRRTPSPDWMTPDGMRPCRWCGQAWGAQGREPRSELTLHSGQTSVHAVSFFAFPG